MPCEDASSVFFEILDEVLEFCYYDCPKEFDSYDEEAHLRYVFKEVESTYLIRIADEVRAMAKHRLRGFELVRFQCAIAGALMQWYATTKKAFYRLSRAEAADVLYDSVLAAVHAEQNDEASLSSFRIDVSDIVAKTESVRIEEPIEPQDDGDWRLKWHVAKEKKVKKQNAVKRVSTAEVEQRSKKLPVCKATNVLGAEQRKKMVVPILLGRNKPLVLVKSPSDVSFKIPTNKEIDRAGRDRVQRLARKRRDALLLKDLPKRAREQSIKKQRDKRVPVFQAGDVKSGYAAIFGTLAAAGVVTAGVGYLGYKTYKKYKKMEAQASEVVEQCKKAADDVSALVASARSVMEKADAHADGVFKAADDAGGLIAMARSIVERVKAAVTNDFWIVPIVVAALYFASYYPGGIAVSVLTLAIMHFMPKAIWKHVGSYFTDARPQDGDCSMIGKVLAVVCCFSCMRNFSSFSNPYIIGELAKRLSNFPKMSEGWNALAEWTITCVEAGINWILSFFSAKRISLLYRKRSVLEDWCNRVDAQVKYAMSKEFTLSNTVLDTYVQLIAEGYDLREIYRGTPLMRELTECLARVSELLRPHQGSLNARKNFRVEPEFLLLRGAPGIGKTLMTVFMASHVMVRSGLISGDDPEAVQSNIFQKGNSPYWNGYSGQITLVKDDAYQLVDQPNVDENEFISDIRAISSWSYPLNFADLDSKGKIYFTSQFIIGTTNRDNLEHSRESIYAPEAVYRRIAHPYTLDVVPEFKNEDGTLNFNKYEVEKNKSQTFPWHIWRMYKHDYRTGVTDMRKAYSALEVIEGIAARLRKKNAEHNACKDDLTKYILNLPKLAEDKIGAQPDCAQPLPQQEEIQPVEEGEFLVNSRSAHGPKTEAQWFKWFRRLSQDEKVAEMSRLEELYPEDYDEPEFQAGREFSGREHWDQFKEKMNEGVNDEGEQEDLEWMAENAVKHAFNASVYTRARLHGFASLTIFAYELGKLAIKIWLAWKAFKLVFGFVFDLVAKAFEYINPFNKKDLKGGLQSNRPIGKVNPNAAERQAGMTPIVHNAFESGYKMICVGPIKDVVLGTVTFVGDNLAVYPTHFDDSIERSKDSGCTDLRFIAAKGEAYHFTFPIATFQEFRRFKAADEVTFVEFGQVRSHRKIDTNFIEESDLQCINGRNCKLPVCEVSVGNKFMPGYDAGRSMTNMFEISKPIYRPRGVQFKSFKLDRAVEYMAATENGDCGSLLCLTDSSRFNGRAIIGFHVAGSPNGCAYAVPITQKMIKEAQEYFQTIKDDFFEDASDRGVVLQSGDVEFFPAGSFQPIGVLADGPNLNPNTKYYKTQYFGELGDVDLSPAHLRPVVIDGKTVYPMLNAIAPYNTPVTHYLPGDWNTTVYSAMIPFTSCSRANTRTIFDFETAVLGDPRLGYFRSVPRNTAPGYPYCLERKPGKKEYLGYGEVYDLEGPKAQELKKRVEYIISQAKSNTRLCHIFVDFLKDELRPARKNDLVQTRLISSSPMDYTIAFRMMFGAFMNAVMQHHIHCGMAPGICTYTEWEVLWTALTRKGDKVIAGDFKAFDSSLQPPVLWAILEFINDWYDDGEENKRARKVLWCDLVHSRHVGGNGTDQVHVYQWNKSLPSGHPFTTIVNSMYSLTMLVAAVSKLVRKDTSHFWNICAAVTYGDDNVLNVCDSVAPLVTQVALGQVMQDFGMKYTSDDKTAELGSHSEMGCITFLKRSFRKKKGRVVCPSDLDSFLYTFYYGKNKKLHDEIMISVMENALEELSMHDEELWNQHAPKIYACLSRRVVPRFPCRQQAYLNAVLLRSDNWY